LSRNIILITKPKAIRCGSTYRSTYKGDHQILLFLVEHRASTKSFQALRSPAIPLTSFHNFLVLLIYPLLSFATFSSAYLFFLITEDSNLMRFSLLLLLPCVMCVQSNSIFFFLSEFLLASVWCFSIILRL